MVTIPYAIFKSQFPNGCLSQSNENGIEARKLLNSILVNIAEGLDRRSIIVKKAIMLAWPEISDDGHLDTSSYSFVTNFGKTGKGNIDYAWELYYWLHCELAPDNRLDEIDRLLINGKTFAQKAKRSVKLPISKGEPQHTVSKNNLTLKTQKLIDKFIEHNLRSYEPLGLEDDFMKMVQSGTGNRWLLTAGAGMGKTALMSNMMDRAKKLYKTVPYFFIQSGQKTKERNYRELGNQVKDFYSFAIATIQSHYPVADNWKRRSQQDNSTALSELLWYLDSLDLLTGEKQLLFIIDGLDEIDAADESSDQLNLPQMMPDGVFIAYSTRIRTKSDADLNKYHSNLPIYDQHIYLGWGKSGELQRKAMLRYTDRLCKTNTFIKPYHANTIGREEQNNFVKTICKKADSNAMILTCILNEKSYWDSKKIDDELELSDDLDDYYHKHLNRMSLNNKGSCQVQPVFCFSMTDRLSAVNFYRLTLGKDEKERKAHLTMQLKEWLAQGLIIEDITEGIRWLKPYHHTYRQFLSEQVSNLDDEQFFTPALCNLREHVSIEDISDPDHEERPEQVFEWLYLWLHLAKITQNLGAIRQCALSIEMWEFLCIEGFGVGRFFRQIGMFAVNEQQLPRYERFYEELSSQFRGWVPSERIINPESKKPYQYTELQTIAENSGVFATRSRKKKSIKLSEFL